MFPFPNFNVPPPDLGQIHNLTDNVDQKIKSFLRANNLHINKNISNEPKTQLRITDINLKFSELTKSKNLLQNLYEEMKNDCNKLSENEWNQKLSTIEEIKKNIDLNVNFIRDNLTEINRIIKNRRNKRQRVKKRKAIQREQFKQILINREIKSREIDENIKKIHEKLKAEEQTNLKKRETEKILASVSKRIREAKDKIELFESLIQLRRVKKQQAQDINDLNEKTFLQEMLHLKNLWEQTLDQCLNEKLELEEYLENKFKNEPKTLEEEWSQALFGSENITKNKVDLNSFLSIRQSWDRCIVPESDPDGSKIPICWVLPNANPSAEWQKYQAK